LKVINLDGDDIKGEKIEITSNKDGDLVEEITEPDGTKV
jgi:hypothetical protein